MSARTVIEHALRVYYADSRDPQALVDTLLAQYDAERTAIPALWVADYDGAPLTLHLTRDAAREACDDVAKVDARDSHWDWRTEAGDTDRQFWTHPDDDRPIGYTGGSVWQITVEGSEKDTRGEPSPQQGESTHRHTRPCEFPTVLPCTCPRPSGLPDASFIRARRMARVVEFFRSTRAARNRAWSAAS
jgi:hypothetical protein